MKKLLVMGGAMAVVAGGVLLAAGLARVGEQPAKLTWRDAEVKPALMTFAYKVYGDPKVEFGRHYLSKMVFTNSGDQPIRDFSISYKLDEHIPWTDPEITHDIPPHFTFVKLFYPKLPSAVSKLRNPTNSTLQTRVRWSENGREREETFTRNVVLRGVNELAYTDLPQSELQSWFDLFNNFAFSVAMVTPNDPVVHLYSSEITKQAGGTTAGISGGAQEIGRLCRITYDYMVATGLRYTGDSGVPQDIGNVTTIVQTVRLPRDVIINNQGLCIELSLLWASVLEHLGVRAALVNVPGHTFVIAYAPELGLPLSQGLPIECTAITPRAVGAENPVSFDEAVQFAMKKLKECQDDGRIFILPVQEIQAMGFTPPELPDIDIAKLEDTLEKRLPRRNDPEIALRDRLPNVPAPIAGDLPQPNPQPLPVTPALPAGFTAWSHPQNLVSFAFPADFVRFPINPAVSGLVLLSVGNPMTGIGCDVMQVNGTQDTNQALQYIANTFAGLGAQLQVDSTTPGGNGVVRYTGSTYSAMSATRWTCLAHVVPGGVIFVSAGTGAAAMGNQAALVQTILSTIRFNI